MALNIKEKESKGTYYEKLARPRRRAQEKRRGNAYGKGGGLEQMLEKPERRKSSEGQFRHAD